jgi:uncharacterized protein (TIGR02001 family)
MFKLFKEILMRHSILSAAISGALALPGIAVAQSAAPAVPAGPHSFSGNVALASEYIYRGIGQTNRRPALQGGVDYAHASGFYLGAWGSTISWITDQNLGASGRLEVDLYGGYKNSIGDWSYDAGVLRYWYPGSYGAAWLSANDRPNTTEVYGSIGWKWLSLKYSQTVTPLFGWKPAVGNTTGSGYWDLSANYDLGGGWGINGHLGHQQVKNLGIASYSDWKLGLTKEVEFGTLGVAYWSTNARGSVAGDPYYNASGRDLGRGRVLLSFTKTF